ncbi:CsbD family protein [Sodalis sp. dw_96]|uniref:CsbD family protein n=1 Tax=Sodalis sp. dw_96 TaxID=2719794 RepID=UPI001BD64B14|nr:CsbD family protein [Sodalis sp. dw_96]
MFDKAKNKAEEAAGKGQEALGKATGDTEMNLEGKVRKQAAQACYSVNDCIDTIKAKTSDDPIPALLIAGGVGFLLAKIFRPRHH